MTFSIPFNFSDMPTVSVVVNFEQLSWHLTVKLLGTTVTVGMPLLNRFKLHSNIWQATVKLVQAIL